MVDLTTKIVANLAMKPTAGVLAVMTYPAEGAWKTLQKACAKKQEDHQHKIRILDGISAFQSASKLEKSAIIAKFQAVKAATNDRKKKYRFMVEKEMAIKSTPHDLERTYSGTTHARTSYSGSSSLLPAISHPTSPGSYTETPGAYGGTAYAGSIKAGSSSPRPSVSHLTGPSSYTKTP